MGGAGARGTTMTSWASVAAGGFVGQESGARRRHETGERGRRRAIFPSTSKRLRQSR